MPLPETLTRAWDEGVLSAFYSEWSWLIDTTYTPVTLSVFGDPFLEKDEHVYWLNTGTAELTMVAQNKETFYSKIHNGEGDKWLLPKLAGELAEQGMIPSDDQCYSYETLPILGGSYSKDNFYILSLKEHLGVTGSLHQQMKDLPDGSKVKVRIED